MRLDKYISQSSGLSRKEAKLMLKQRRVTVDGGVVVSADQPVGEANVIEVDGEMLSAPSKHYFMLHKPRGVVCARSDLLHPTVLSLIEEPFGQRLHPVGRLDIDTTGLVLLTDDGQWSHGIASPKKDKCKVYDVTLADTLVENAEERFKEGLLLKGEEKPTLAARLVRLSSTQVQVTLHEGRYHQVKRMFAALGNRVISLHRSSIGTLVLDAKLKAGEYRTLTKKEIEALK